MASEYTGGCLCGTVRFRFRGPPRFVGECVCESCRRAHGASAVAWVGLKHEQFELIAGEASLSWFQSSAASERGYCPDCGTRMLFRSSRWPGETHVALACLDAHDLVSGGVSFAKELPAWTALKLPA